MEHQQKLTPVSVDDLRPALVRGFFEWFHGLVHMLGNVDPYIFGSDLRHIYYSYNVEHYNVNPCSVQCVPKVFSYLHNEE